MFALDAGIAVEARRTRALSQSVVDSALSVDSASAGLQARISAFPLHALLVSFAIGVAAALELSAASAGFSSKAVGTQANSAVLRNLANGIFAAGGLALVTWALALAADTGAIVGTVVVVSAAESANSVGAKLTLRAALVVRALRTAVAVGGARLSTIAVLDASAALGAETVLAVCACEGALSVV